MEEYLINSKLIKNCLKNDNHLFGANIDEQVTIDGKSGKAIPGEFAAIYGEQDDDNIAHLLNNINVNLRDNDLEEISKIYVNVVREAV